eukprot:m.186096 g.186096  ORF g.186096 m.186096 type:complete len:479 (+) comp16918_c0_seq5:1156-2592(+)
MCSSTTPPHRAIAITDVRRGSGVSAIIEGQLLLVYKRSKLLFRLESWQIWRQAELNSRFQAAIWKPKRGCWQLLGLQLPCDTKFDTLRLWLNNAITESQNRRPQCLRVYINPVGGRKKALPLFERVHSLLTMAGIELEEVVTTRAFQCREELSELDLSGYDGILIAGGDGFLAEAIQGLMERQDGMHLPIGLLPAGSTNTVAYSCSGSADVFTWAINVILGIQRPLDLGRITSPELESPLFATNFICNGFFSSVVADSERHRWMGPFRYSFSGFKQVIKHTHYQDFQMKLVSDAETKPFVDSSQAGVKLAAVAFMPLRSPQSKRGLVPHAAVSSGAMMAVCVRKCSRIQWLRFLLRVNGPGTQWKLPYTTTQSCDKMLFTSTGNDNVWNIDGEIHRLSNLEVTVLPGAIQLYDSSWMFPNNDAADHRSSQATTVPGYPSRLSATGAPATTVPDMSRSMSPGVWTPASVASNRQRLFTV